MKTYHDLVKKFSAQLEMYETQESQTLIQWLLEYHLGLRRVDMANFMHEDDLPVEFLRDFDRLKTGEPIQYVLGEAPFYGREFRVSRDTLIPRNETEELVHWIIKEHKLPNLKILDIGTGTGCIPVTLALEMNSPTVVGYDISEGALSIARSNAQELNASVGFMQLDILTQLPKLDEVEILVSNPPYVLNSDKLKMHSNVLDFEPESALFVSDDDPLVFYRRIAEVGRKILKSQGSLYFEIHENFGREISDVLEECGYEEIEIRKDLNDKDRMARAVWP